MGAVGSCAWLLWHSERLGLIKAVGLSLLAFVLLGPVVQPWYLAWGLVLLAPLGFRRWRPVLVGLTLLGAFIGFPGGYLLLRELGEASLWSVAVAVGVLLAIPLPPLVAKVREMIANRAARRRVLDLVGPAPSLDLVPPQPALVD